MAVLFIQMRTFIIQPVHENLWSFLDQDSIQQSWTAMSEIILTYTLSPWPLMTFKQILQENLWGSTQSRAKFKEYNWWKQLPDKQTRITGGPADAKRSATVDLDGSEVSDPVQKTPYLSYFPFADSQSNAHAWIEGKLGHVSNVYRVNQSSV